VGKAVKSIGGALGIGGGGGGGSAGPRLDTSIFQRQKEIDERTKQARDASLGLITDLQKQSRGEGPSLATEQLKSATSRSLAQTLAAAAAQRGGSPALTQRNILMAKSAGDRQIAEQGALARMQEQQAAQNQLANLAQGQQASDLSQVMQPAQLAAQGEEMRFSADVARRNAVKAQQNQLLGQALSTGASAAMMMSDETQKVSLDSMGPGAMTQAEFAKALAQKMGPGAATPNDLYRAQIGDGDSRFSKLVAKFQMKPENNVSLPSIGPEMFMKKPVTLSPENKAIISDAAATNNMSASPELLSSLFNSDENNKKQVVDPKSDVNKFLDALQARSYAYKDTSKPGTAPGKRYGIMAQDLEKSEMGKSLVRETPVGKMVDTVQGFGAVLAAQAEMNKRLKKLEKGK